MNTIETLSPSDMAKVGRMIKEARNTTTLVSTFQTADYTVIVERDGDYNVDVHIIFND